LSTNWERSVIGVSATWLGLDKGRLTQRVMGGNVGIEPSHRKAALYRAALSAHVDDPGFVHPTRDRLTPVAATLGP
jgi:hypothetical protein